jgi:hypothetical protein
LIGKPEERRPLGRPRGILEEDLKTDLEEMESADVDWIHLAQDRDQLQALVNTV